MATTKIVTLTIDPETAEVEVETAGYQGKGCAAVVEAFVKDFGGRVTEDRRKLEYNTPVTNQLCVKR
jgi:hypothetical protein